MRWPFGWRAAPAPNCSRAEQPSRTESRSSTRVRSRLRHFFGEGDTTSTARRTRVWTPNGATAQRPPSTSHTQRRRETLLSAAHSLERLEGDGSDLMRTVATCYERLRREVALVDKAAVARRCAVAERSTYDLTQGYAHVEAAIEASHLLQEAIESLRARLDATLLLAPRSLAVPRAAHAAHATHAARAARADHAPHGGETDYAADTTQTPDRRVRSE